MSERKTLTPIAIVALATGLRLAVFVMASAEPERFLAPPDSQEYVQLARNLLGGHGWSLASMPPYVPDPSRTPVYPAIVAAALKLDAGGLWLVVLVNVAFSVATVLGVYFAVRGVGGERAAVVAGAIVALDITSIVYANLILTETAFTTLLVLGIVAMVATEKRQRITTAVGAGAAWGLAALCRPIGVLLPAVLVPYVLCRQRVTIKLLLVVSLVFFAMVSLWIVRNSRTFGVATISPVGSFNLYFHRAAYVTARVTGEPDRDVRSRWEREFQAMSAQWTLREQTDWLQAEATKVIWLHPWLYLRLCVEGVVRLLGPEREHIDRLLGVGSQSASRAIQSASWIQLLITYALAVWGCAVGIAAPDMRSLTILLVCITVYFLAVGGPEMYSRFRVPLMPVFAGLAGLPFARRAH